MSEEKTTYNAIAEHGPRAHSINVLLQAVEKVQWGRVTANIQAGRIVLIEVTETKKLT